MQPATSGSNFRRWQEYAVETLAGRAKDTADRISLEKFAAGLYASDQQPQRLDVHRPEANLNKFMYTKGQFSNPAGTDSVAVDTVLWDTGDGGPCFVSESFVSANETFFKPMEGKEDSSIFLADAVHEIKITKNVRGVLTIIGTDGAVANINTVFSIIPMQCNIILGLKDMIFQAPDMLVSMILQASAFAKRKVAERDAEKSSQVPPMPLKYKGVFRAQQLARGESRRVPHPRPRPEMADCQKIALQGMGYVIRPKRPPRNLYSINVGQAADNVFSGQEQYPLVQSERGQNLMPPWFQRDDLGAEENDSPYPGMFSEFVHFMETTVEKAVEEYLAEVAKAPTPAPSPSPPEVKQPVEPLLVPPKPPDIVVPPVALPTDVPSAADRPKPLDVAPPPTAPLDVLGASVPSAISTQPTTQAPFIYNAWGGSSSRDFPSPPADALAVCSVPGCAPPAPAVPAVAHVVTPVAPGCDTYPITSYFPCLSPEDWLCQGAFCHQAVDYHACQGRQEREVRSRHVRRAGVRRVYGEGGHRCLRPHQLGRHPM